jgi:rhodanese-related sulfurtransferase
VRARDFGYANAYVMPDGIAGWEHAKQPVETS